MMYMAINLVQEGNERTVPAVSLPEGRNWIHYEDASGHLQSPDGKSYFSYDWFTGEYKETEDGEYSFFLKELYDECRYTVGNFQDFQKEAENWIKEHIL